MSGFQSGSSVTQLQPLPHTIDTLSAAGFSPSVFHSASQFPLHRSPPLTDRLIDADNSVENFLPLSHRTHLLPRSAHGRVALAANYTSLVVGLVRLKSLHVEPSTRSLLLLETHKVAAVDESARGEGGFVAGQGLH